LRDERVWILDTEANGEHPGEIIELAAVEMVGLTLTGRHHEWRFRPRQGVNQSATRVHGITDRDLRQCPRIEAHLPEIRELLGDHAIAGHAVHVELGALQRVLPDWEPVRAYDTLRMARRALPDLERHRLQSVGDHLSLSRAAAKVTGRRVHSALYDAMLCGMILRHLADPLDEAELAAMVKHAEIMAIRRERARQEQRKAVRAAIRQRYRTGQLTDAAARKLMEGT